MTVLLNGRKVGHEEIRRERSGDIVITTQTLVMDIERNPHSRESGGAFNSEAGQSTFKLHKSNLNFPRTRE